MKFNRKVDQIFLSGTLAIDLTFGERSLRSYLHELELLDAGVPFSELGIKERKAAQLPRFVSQEGEEIEVSINDDEDIEIPRGSIARLYLAGVMYADDGLSSYGVRTICNWIERFSNDPAIDGILLEVNSGGGELTAGQMLQSAIEASKIPVIGWLHFCGSAAVKGTLACDELIATSQYAEIGSIGTLYIMNDKFVRWFRKNINEIYSEKSPDKNKMWREYLEGDRSGFLNDATEFDEMFMQDVRDHRPLKGNVEETLAGGMFVANEAKDRGLIDGIGNINYALRRLTSHINFNKQRK